MYVRPKELSYKTELLYNIHLHNFISDENVCGEPVTFFRQTANRSVPKKFKELCSCFIVTEFNFSSLISKSKGSTGTSA